MGLIHPAAWLRSTQVKLVGAVQLGLRLSRSVLPSSVLRRLPGRANKIVSALATPIGARFDQRPIKLPDWRPLFEAGAFADGPVVLANDALAWGGAERQIVTTVQGLDSRGVANGLLCLRLHETQDLDFFVDALSGAKGFVRNAMGRGAAERVLDAIAARAVKRIDTAIAWLPYDVQANVLRLAAEFSVIKPRVVHGWQDATNIAAGYAAIIVGVPRIVLSTLSVAPVHFGHYRPYMPDAYRELAACRSVSFTCNSEAGARDYESWLGLAGDSYTVVRMGIDTARLRRVAPERTRRLRSGLGIPDDAPIVGSIIRFFEEKQPLLWVDVAARILKQRPDCHFVIFGTGPMRQATLDAARQQGFADRLHCPGTIADSAEGLSLFDVFLLTSRMEGTPNVTLEASLIGVPVVATDAGGTRETIAQDVTGCVVGISDAGGLAERVLSILANPAWSARARIEGPAFVERRFGVERMLDEMIGLYCPASGDNRQD